MLPSINTTTKRQVALLVQCLLFACCLLGCAGSKDRLVLAYRRRGDMSGWRYRYQQPFGTSNTTAVGDFPLICWLVSGVGVWLQRVEFHLGIVEEDYEVFCLSFPMQKYGKYVFPQISEVLRRMYAAPPIRPGPLGQYCYLPTGDGPL